MIGNDGRNKNPELRQAKINNVTIKYEGINVQIHLTLASRYSILNVLFYRFVQEKVQPFIVLVPCQEISSAIQSAASLTHVDFSGMAPFTDFTKCWTVVLSKIPVRQLQDLNLSGIVTSTPQLNQIANRFPKLKRINLGGSLVETESLSSFFTICSELETLDLSNNSINNVSFDELPLLTNLKLSLCEDINDYKISQITLRCPKMECLVLNVRGRISKSSLDAINLGLPRLKKLVIQGYFEGGLGQHFTTFFHLKSLEYLYISHQGFFTDPVLLSIALYTENGLLQLANLHQLECLSLRGFDSLVHMTEGALKEIAKSNTNLKKLYIPDSPEVTDDCISFVLDNCKDLVELDVFGCRQVTNKTLHALIAKLTTLHGINFPQDHGEKKPLRNANTPGCVSCTDPFLPPEECGPCCVALNEDNTFPQNIHEEEENMSLQQELLHQEEDEVEEVNNFRGGNNIKLEDPSAD
uniref:Uncharacterized protein n=1 Tax=Ditylenchus dipsaci TaxID=166011 RepID=A0A915CMD7_9BILA